MRLALDTNRYCDFARGLSEAVQTIEAAEAVFIPLPVLAELRVGFVGGDRARRNEAKLVEFLAQSGVGILLPDEQTTRQYAAVYHQLRRQGTPIPTNDIWIAALVLQHGLALYARDAHFDHLPQITRV